MLREAAAAMVSSLNLRVEAHPGLLIGIDVQEKEEAILAAGLIDLAAQFASTCGRLPVNAARVVTQRVLTYPSDAQGIFEQAARGGTLTKGMARGQAKGLDGRDQRVDQQRLTDLHPLLAREPAKGVATTGGRRPEGIDATGSTTEPVAARHALEGPERKGIHKRHPVD